MKLFQREGRERGEKRGMEREREEGTGGERINILCVVCSLEKADSITEVL